MAKKVRFPLEMDNGVEVRDIHELKEKFSLNRVLNYLADGRLITWLRDRYEDDIANEILEIQNLSGDISYKSNDYLKKSPVYGHFRKTAA